VDIKVLGTGCAKCKNLEKYVREALEDLGVEATIEKVTDIEKIVEYGVLLTPALVIDEVVKVSGRLPHKTEVKEIIQGQL
jgi:small redox-active disulfide protein 2